MRKRMPYDVKTMLDGITRIEPKIHKTTFSGNYYIKDLKRVGKCYYDKNYEFNSVKKNSIYKKRAFVQLPEGKISFYYNDRSVLYSFRHAVFPKCWIQVPNTNRNLLIELGEAMGALKLSSIEYTIDFFCTDPSAVSNLFYLFNRYLYVPYAKKIYRAGGDFKGWKEPRYSNAVYKLAYKGKQRRFTIYERGPDKLAEDGYWLHSLVDRIRLESNLTRKSYALKKRGPQDIFDLIYNTRFSDVFFPNNPQRRLFRFLNFKDVNSRYKFPKDDEDYSTFDEYGSVECLMNEIFSLKKNGVSKINSYLEDTYYLLSFIQRIIESVRQFEKEWC